MTRRYGNHNTEDFSAPQDSATLDLAPQDHAMAKLDSYSSDKYSKEIDTCHPLAELLEQFWQLQDQLACLKSATHPPTHMVELMQLMDNYNTLL